MDSALSHTEISVCTGFKGVPQGSILGTNTVLLYVNVISEPIQNVKIVQYADDKTLCTKSNTKTDLEINSYIALNSCIQNFSEINLKKNSSKNNIINFPSSTTQ